MRNQRVYDEAFKENAINLCKVAPSIRSVARDLGVDESSIRKWIKSSQPNSSEIREIEELKKLNSRLEMENAILKKAMGIISRRDR